MGSILPVEALLRELVAALGGALLLSSLAVALREAFGRSPKTPNWKVVLVNAGVGAVLAVWGITSIVAAR